MQPATIATIAKGLRGSLSKEARIMTATEDADSPAFQTSLSRWTYINKQTPSVIIQPACEADVELIVLSFPFAISFLLDEN